MIYLVSVVKILRKPESPVERETRRGESLENLPIFGYQPSPRKAQDLRSAAGRESPVEKLLKIVRRERKNG
jgi:hypothetical protein